MPCSIDAPHTAAARRCRRPRGRRGWRRRAPQGCFCARLVQPLPPHSVAPEREFSRPAWCPDARFPHERLVCADAELAGRDLRLASFWAPYRRTLSRADEAWHKSDYFQRLKACGADKACIVNEQDAQLRRYRAGLPAGG